MSSLIRNLGLRKNPFSVYSAEEEKEYLNEVYFKPRYFDTIYESVANGASQFIFGGRGSGKSALVIELENLLKEKNSFTVVIGSYEGLSLENNEKDFLIRILEKCIKSFCLSTFKSPEILKKLDKFQKEKLAFLIKEFFVTTSKTEYEKSYSKATGFLPKNRLKRFWNSLISKPINILTSSIVEIGSDFVRKSFNLPDVDSKVFIKDYFPEFDLDKIEKGDIPRSVGTSRFFKNQIKDLTEIITTCGYGSVVIFIDRIDEFSELNGKIDKIVLFIKDYVNRIGLAIGS